MKILVVFLSLLSLCLFAKLPGDFPSCKGSKNLNECLKPAIENALRRLENGIPELSIPPLLPLNIPSVTIGESKGAVNVVQNYKNFILHGHTVMQVKKVESSLSPTELKLDIDSFMPELGFDADYDFNGRILLLPIVGNGKCKVVIKDLRFGLKLLAETFQKKDKSYFKVKNITLDLVPEKAEMKLENLFNGDSRLGAEMNKVLNDNGLVIFEDIKGGYIEVLETVFKDYANKIFTVIPSEDLF